VIMLVVEGGEETPVPTDVAATDST
jgi:hypothetical protein